METPVFDKFSDAINAAYEHFLLNEDGKVQLMIAIDFTHVMPALPDLIKKQIVFSNIFTGNLFVCGVYLSKSQ